MWQVFRILYIAIVVLLVVVFTIVAGTQIFTLDSDGILRANLFFTFIVALATAFYAYQTIRSNHIQSKVMRQIVLENHLKIMPLPRIKYDSFAQAASISNIGSGIARNVYCIYNNDLEGRKWPPGYVEPNDIPSNEKGIIPDSYFAQVISSIVAMKDEGAEGNVKFNIYYDDILDGHYYKPFTVFYVYRNSFPRITSIISGVREIECEINKGIQYFIKSGELNE